VPAIINFTSRIFFKGEAGTNREGYPLRPELIESVMYLYRATGDPYLLEVGKDILRSIQHSARTSCGYATVCTSR
jgi:mannosidase alpha-like ER degradation enhancer 2